MKFSIADEYNVSASTMEKPNAFVVFDNPAANYACDTKQKIYPYL